MVLVFPPPSPPSCFELLVQKVRINGWGNVLPFTCPADFSGFGQKASDLSRRESLSFGGHHPWPAPQPGAGGAGSRGAHQMSAQVCSVVCLHPMLQLAVCMPPTNCLLQPNLELACEMHFSLFLQDSTKAHHAAGLDIMVRYAYSWL